MTECVPSIHWEGAPSSDILLVAQSPGGEELREQRPLIGPSGELLWKLLAPLGIYRQHVSILNACCQLPVGGPSRAAPTDAQLLACRPMFDEFLALSRPKIILCLGGVAFRAITGRPGSVDALRGQLFQNADVAPIRSKEQAQIGFKVAWESRPTGEVYKTGPRKGQPKMKKHRVPGEPKFKTVTVNRPRPLPDTVEWIIPTFHPASMLYNKFVTLPAFRQDLKRASRLARGEDHPRPIEFEQTPVPLGSGPIAFDIETNPSGSISRIGFASLDGAWTSTWADNTVEEAARLLLSDALKIAHNLSFDLGKLREFGIPVQPPYFDTMLAFQMLQPDLFKGLEKVTSFYFPIRPWKHLSGSEPAFYNACDAVHTRRLYDPLRSDLEATGMLDHFESVVMRCVPTLVEMKENGLLCSPERLRQWQTALLTEQTSLLDQWQVRHPHVSPSSPVQLKRLLYDELSLPVQLDKYRKVTTEDAALAALLGKGHDETIRLVRDIREISKLFATYAKADLAGDGRVHPSYLPARKDDLDESGRKLVAASGRLAASDPPIHQQPQIARRIYVPPPGHVFIEFDWSQLELWIAAALAADTAMLADLESDIHSRVQERLGCDRTRAKNVMYGTIYGAGPRTLSALLKKHGVSASQTECKQLQDALASAYPGLWSWRRRVIELGASQQFLANPFGRRRYFYWGTRQAPEMVDFLPQSTGADMMLSVLPDLARIAQPGKLICSVHDSALLEVPLDHAERVKGEGALSMGREWPIIAAGFRVPVAAKTSTSSWGEMNADEDSP